MRLLPDGEYNKLQDDFASHLDGICHIHRIARASGTYGSQVAETRTSVTGVACDIEFTGGAILERGQVLIVDYDVVLMLPSNQSVSMGDDVELVEKGHTLISGTFKPASQPVVNEIFQTVNLKRKV